MLSVGCVPMVGLRGSLCYPLAVAQHAICECGFAVLPGHAGSQRHLRGLRIVALMRADVSFAEIGRRENLSREAITQLAARVGYSGRERLSRARNQREDEGRLKEIEMLVGKWPYLLERLIAHRLSFEPMTPAQITINGHICLLRKSREKRHQGSTYIQIHKLETQMAFDFALFFVPETRTWLIFPRPNLPRHGTMFSIDSLAHTRSPRDYRQFVEAWRMLGANEKPRLPEELPTDRRRGSVFVVGIKKPALASEEQIARFYEDRAWNQEQAERLDAFERA